MIFKSALGRFGSILDPKRDPKICTFWHCCSPGGLKTHPFFDPFFWHLTNRLADHTMLEMLSNPTVFMIFKRPMSKNALFGPQIRHQIWCFCCCFWTSFWAPSRRNFAAPFLWICFKTKCFFNDFEVAKKSMFGNFWVGKSTRKIDILFFICLPFKTLTSRICFKSNGIFMIFCFYGRLSGRLLDLPKAENATKRFGFSMNFKLSEASVFSFFMKLLLPSRTSVKLRNSGAISIVKTLRL